MDGRGSLSPEFSKRVQEVLGLTSAPASVDDLKDALRERVVAGSLDVEPFFSERETPHQVEFEGEVRHTHCALDALLLPFLTGRRITLRSGCPHCGETVTVEASPMGFHSSHPEAVLSLGVSREGKGSVQENACPFINLFPSGEHYRAWAAARDDALTVMLSVDEAAEITSFFPCC